MLDTTIKPGASKKEIWDATRKLLKSAGITTRGEDKSSVDPNQVAFECTKLYSQPVCLGKHR